MAEFAESSPASKPLLGRLESKPLLVIWLSLLVGSFLLVGLGPFARIQAKASSPQQRSGDAGAANQEETQKRSGVLQRLRNRMENGNSQETTGNEKLGDRLRDRLGTDPDGRLLPGLLNAAQGKDPKSLEGSSSGNANSGIPGAGFADLNSPQIVSSEATIGTQYNVGHIVFRLAPEDLMRWQTRAIFVDDREGRILFPAMMPSFMERLTAQVSDPTTLPPRDINIWFLFSGRQPLDVTIYSAVEHQVRLEPAPVGRLRQRVVMQTWWRQFNAMLEEQAEASDYPPLVQAYLGSMVQQRMGMSLPLLQRQKQQPTDPMTATWYLLTGAEDLQVESMRELMAGQSDTGAMDQSPPQNIAWQSHSFPWDGQPVEVEPIANVVPQECFYLRFGTWANQIWLKQLLEEHGGDLSRMVRLRGYQSMVGDVFRDQLALQSSQLDDLFGGTLIQDVAVIGLDTFFNDGAAAGIIFHAKNGLLKGNMEQKRREYAKAHAKQGVTLQDVQVGDQVGSLLQSPDGKVRSLMVSSGDFILVCTSFALAQRFLESSQGVGTLGQSQEFQHARRQMPLSREDTIFVYFSTAFLENLLSPHYQIELKRRLRSITEIQALQLASWTAAAQGLQAPGPAADWELVDLPQRIDALKNAGLLPETFNARPDGSRIGLMQDLNWNTPEESIPGRESKPGKGQEGRTDVAPGELTLEGDDAGPLPLEGPQDKPESEKNGTKGGSLLGSMLGMLGGKSGGGVPDALQQEQRQAEAVPGVPVVSLQQLMERSPVGGLLYGDTHRGVRGWMVPVADMPLQQVTMAEQQWYQQRAKYFSENWVETDPIMIGIKRYGLDDQRERVVFDGRVAPFGSQKYKWLTDSIGPPMASRPAKSPDDVIRLEVSIADGALLQSVGAHQLFASVQRDAQQLSSVDPGEWWTTLKLIQDTPGYIGSWPTAGWLDLLPMLGGRPDEDGFTHSIGRRIWRMQHEGFSVVATSRERLDALRPYLTMVPAENPAQVRLEVSDLNDSQLAGWTNALWRQRSWQASLANTRLLHLLMQHFRLKPEKARQKAQSLLNARLVCSLDGEYQLVQPDQTTTEDGLMAVPFQSFWISDRWPADPDQAAELWAQEESPLLKWFRGAMLEVLQEEQRFLVHGYLDIRREVKETAALPGFDLFQGFSFK